MSDFLTILETQGLSIALVIYLLWKDHTQGKVVLETMKETAISNIALAKAIKSLERRVEGNGIDIKDQT